MEIATAIFGPVIGPVVDSVVGPVVGPVVEFLTDELRNLTHSAERVDQMGKKRKLLDSQRIDNQKRRKRNRENNLEIPSRVSGWLKEVKKVTKDVDQIPTNNDGWLNVVKKYRAGKNALRLTEDIEGLIKESSDMIWSNAPIGLGRVNFKGVASRGTQNLFKSRDKIFNDALKLLQQNDNDAARVIALCGMGGVGKTTLMKQLKEAAEDKKMFNWIVVVVIGNTPNLLGIQKAIAVQTGEALTENDETLMANKLSKRFKVFAEHEERSLVILDDVWEKIKLEDIGLGSPLPKGVKLLLTSRDANICRQIAVSVPEVVVSVDLLEEGEAVDFFCQIAGISAERDRDLYQIGCDIVKICDRLPLAIEIIAATLKGEKNRRVWNRTLKCLKKNDDVLKIVDLSYKKLKREEDKAIFLLCGLFPEDSNIPKEDLTRYAWGLKLLKQVSTMEDARDSIEASVSNLKNAYLLMDGDSHHSDCVKLHDLVLAFVVDTISKGGEDGCSISHHDDFSKWSEADNKSEACKQIWLACKGMSKFPSDFRFPNLSLLKLMHGDESLRALPDFYATMEKLQVLAFERLEYPVVPTSFQCSKLQTLCLDGCSLMFDLTCIGNLSNLEVLSFANSGITILPSTFGNLKKLRLLDVTGCYNLVINAGVLKSLVKLEELYMRSERSDGGRAPCFKDFDFNYSDGGRGLCLTDNNCRELAKCSENLCALEFEFIGNNTHMENMSYEKLQRFKLSVGCSFTEVRDHVKTDQVDMHSYANSLKLVTNTEELRKSKISELFKFTDALYLQVNDMNTLEAVDVESLHPRHPSQNSSFYNLRLLVISKCAKLKYLFTPSVATNLSNLEYLEISRCPIMEAVIHTKNNGSDIIMFSNLKYLRLDGLPNLLCFSNNDYVIQLPRLVELKLEGLQSFTNIFPSSASSSESSNISCVQSFFHGEDATPKLEKLLVSDMENLKEIWPPQFSISKLCQLRELTVKGCGSIVVLFSMDFGEFEHLCSNLKSITVDECERLVKLFSCNPFPFLNNLQELRVESCGSIQVLINTELGRAGKSEERVCTSSLRSIEVGRCERLVKLFSYNPFPFLNNLQELKVKSCGSIQVLFDIDSGVTGNIGTSSLRSIEVDECERLVKLFSCNPFPFFNNLQKLRLFMCASIEVLFDIGSGRAGKIEEQVCSSSLRRISVHTCDSLVNLLPRNPMLLFNNLEELYVRGCDSIEVIFDIDMGCVGEMDKVSSRLRSISLGELGNLREVWRIKDAGNNFIHGFEAVESIHIGRCDRFENLITPGITNFEMRALKEVTIDKCGRESERKNEMAESEEIVAESEEMAESNQDQEIKVISSSREQVNDDISKVAVPSYLFHTFHHLHKLELEFHAAEVVFEIMSPESAHNTQQSLILPNLKELKLWSLERMSHVWKCNWNDILILQKQQSQCSFHNLTTIEMDFCGSIKYLFSPLMVKLLSNLKKVHIGYCNGIEEVVSNKYDEESCDGIEEVVSNRDDEDASLYSPTFFPHLNILKLHCLENFKCIVGGAYGISTNLKSSQASWSLCKYAREISIMRCDALSSVVPLYAVGQMQKLQVQVLKIEDCKSMTEVFETQEINNKSGTTLKLPNLRILKIEGCHLLKYIFTFSTLESLMQLEELEIKDCKALEVIVKKENGEETTASDVVFRNLKSITLVSLPNFVGFYLGSKEFTWPALEKVVIRECPKITVFTYGQSTAPKLNYIKTSLGRHRVECGLNFHAMTTSHQTRSPNSESSSSHLPATMEGFPLSFHNLIEMDVNYNPSGGQTLFSSDEVAQLQKLETVCFGDCEDIEEIFDSQTVAEIPNLRQVDLKRLRSLKYIWKSKQGTVLKFPNLTRLSIYKCDSLEYLFTCPMVGSISQLQELDIQNCPRMKAIVKGEEEECDAIVNAIVVFPCLKSLSLDCLWSLEGFCIGKEAFEFPSLDTLQIDWCPEMRVFTKGDLSAPKLYAISSWWSRKKYNIHNRLNPFLNISNKRD